MLTDGQFYADCVISNGKLRNITEEEKLLVDWCGQYAESNNKCISNINYATFEMEPYEEEWFDDVREEFKDYILYKNRPNKRDIKLLYILNFQKEWAEAYSKRLEKRIPQTKKVKNLDTGEVFSSMTSACKKYNIDKSNFAKSIKNKWKIGGYHWEYLDK